jgi:TolB-like protein/DNA-binding SARP family transcriptional activator
MLSIRLLGGFELALTAGSTPDRLGPKPQCLLAFLAMSRGAAVPRGRLAGLLWGERDEERARHSLSQALTTVRAVFGPADAAVLWSCSDGVGLATDGLELDVDAFESAARSQQQAILQEACNLYRGEFLAGVESREPGFEEWMLSERYRLGALAADAFARLLDLQFAAGDADAAIETARRLVAMAPLDEPAHARLIELYAVLGRRGLAEAHYARCSELLRHELDRAPGDELRAAIAEARRRSPGKSVRFTPGPTRPDPTRPDDRPQKAKRRAKARWVISAAAGAMLVLLAGVWTFHDNRIGDGGEPGGYQEAPWDLPAAPSIAVLPFDNLSDDPEWFYFADGLTNDIITDLSKFSILFVIASDSSSRYKGGAVQVKEVARDLGVRYVLKGSVRSLDGRLWIDANLIDATTGRHVWAENYERPAENLFAVQKEITQTIAAVVGSDFGELQHAEIERIRRIPTEDLQAYGLYVRGVESKRRETREGNALARELFVKAIQTDPNYARAMAENSLTYLYDVFQGWADSREEWLRRAEELARRAIEIDSSEPWGFVALGVVYQAKAGNEEALSLFETAHALNPNDYGVNMALGYAETYGGSAERGVEILEKTQRLNPYNTQEPTVLVWAYFFAHRYQDALTTINRIARRHTQTYWIYKAAIHAQLDQMAEAHAAIAEALKFNPNLTVQSEHEHRLALGLAPAKAEHLTNALRKAGLPE